MKIVFQNYLTVTKLPLTTGTYKVFILQTTQQ